MSEFAAQPLPISAGASLDIVFDWSEWLTPGDSITSASITASPGVSVANANPPPAGASVTAWISVDAAAAPGRWLNVRCEITTASNPHRVDSRTFRLVVSER